MNRYFLKRFIRLYVVLFLLLVNGLPGQNGKSIQELRNFIAQKRIEMRRAKLQADSLAKIIGLPLRQQLRTGQLIELMRFKNGMPQYYITDNYDAAISTQANKLWSSSGLGFNLSGNGYSKLGEWDGGGVLTTHQEFNAGSGSRVTQVDSPSGTHYHSTHVAGTMIAEGEVAQAIGMASGANLYAYEWTDDAVEMADAALNLNLELSNHSYGYSMGWAYDFRGDGLWAWLGDLSISTTEEYRFGLYDSESSDWDQIAVDYPNYLIVKSAGNDRSDNGPSSGQYWIYNGGWTKSTVARDPDGQYDCLGDIGVAKNVLTVGAVADVTQYDDPSFITMSSFSSWGPADDGRIKPDIVANGVGLYSTFNTADDAYDILNGTSMAAPNATGSMVLLQEHYQNLNSGTPMRSATLKALVINTAIEAGDNPGPDYQFGWGLLDVYSAAKKITEDQDQDVIAELQLSNGGTYERVVTASGSGPLIVTIVWADPPGTPVAASLNPSDPMLVNDLDLRISKDTETYYSWKLDRDNPSFAATNSGENDIDNVEQVNIDNPPAGSYTITVDHDGTLSSPQAFSMVISGINEYSTIPDCSPGLVTPLDGSTNVSLATTIEWLPADLATNYDFYFGTDTPPTNIVNGTNQSSTSYGPALSSNTTYYVKVVPQNDQGSATGCPIWSFSTESNTVASSFPFSEDFEGFSEPGGIGSGNDWSNGTDDDIDWQVQSGATPSAATGPTADHTTGSPSGKYLFIEGDDPNNPGKLAVLNSPYFDLSGLNNPCTEFWYHMYEGYVGEYMGDLIVDVYADGFWNYDVFKRSGNQGNNWWVATIDLSPYKTGSIQQIRFRGITGANWPTDMAIDDVIIKGEAFHTFMAGNLDAHTFPNTGVTLQFSSGNSADLTLTAVRNDYDPDSFGPLPDGVLGYSAERYWTISEDAGTTDGVYNIALDLNGLLGISDFSTLALLKRTGFSYPWLLAGTNNYVGTGTEVTWTGISSGFSDFAIGGEADNSLPVELLSFISRVKNGNVILSWMTKSEVDNLGFIVEKKGRKEEAWREIDSYKSNEKLIGQGNSATEFQYDFLDEEVMDNMTYFYRLSDISYSGQIFRRDSIEVKVSGEDDLSQIPDRYVLKDAYPNPFNPSTNIVFGLPENSRVKIIIYNNIGQKVRTITNKTHKAGWHILKWDGKSDTNTSLGSGQYFYMINTQNYSAVKKILLLR